MASYELVFRKSVAKDLRPIPNMDVARILRRIEELRENPRPAGSEKLSGQERYRIRQGVYRIIYEVRDPLPVVTVVKVAHRKHAYERR
ncbi:type II toxin-antitoxin system RelE/ParE family toxin [Methylonatrum kenyense]|uniref:type II toxin-antitoxin system RelE family toxin n=1 Tax=Methylonatrum kenyense TaxID=455253 RepID=UPI0020C0B150|nr:type II toxin-antitoxin system RelE/ParE family toxin [Methylonatrum kenyense]MCK8515087.1 type II toxin-antitoxin system RelE/ParE family toxin [Methylonatrum kenyense]